MSEILHQTKPTQATPSLDAYSSAPSNNPALSAIAKNIATDPALAEKLASILPYDEFINAIISLAQRNALPLDHSTLTLIADGRYRAFGYRPASWSLADRRGWQPLALEFGPFGVELVWGCGVARAADPFNEQTLSALRALPLNRLLAVRTVLNADLLATLQAEALPIGGLIFHMSRCGSTLLAQALKAWPGERVLSEPSLLDSAITLALSGADPQWLAVRIVFAAMAQPAEADRRLWVKLDAWHALLLAPILQIAPAPWIFVYRDPHEVLVSHARAPGVHTVPGMLADGLLGGQVPAILGREEYAAWVLGRICAAIVPYAGAGHLFNYAELTTELMSRLPTHFDLDMSSLNRTQLSIVMAQHSKRPYEPFDDDRAEKQRAVDNGLREAARRFIEPHYAALENIRRGEAA